MSCTCAVPAAQSSSGPWLLVAELAHRVANEYALAIASVSLAAARSSNAETKAALREAAGRLHDYSAAHRALQAPISDGQIDLAEYLRDLCAAFTKASLKERGVRLTLIEQPIELDAGRCWRVGLILSELITNALRHGLQQEGGQIVVHLSSLGGRVSCRVVDSGRPKTGGEPGRGSRIVEALAEDLGGRIERHFGPYGASVLLSFPATPVLL